MAATHAAEHTPEAPEYSLTIHRGMGLRAMDVGGVSDPYVKIVRKGGKTKTTKAMKATVDPVWNEEFTIKDTSVTLEVWDRDSVTSDDFMDKIVINLEALCDGTEHRLGLGKGAIFVTVRRKDSRAKTHHWKGYWQWNTMKCDMDFSVTFTEDGRIEGSGEDSASGRFTWSGTYNADNEVVMTKTFQSETAGVRIFKGRLDAKHKVMDGTWTNPANGNEGPFHLKD
ncbi:hypothetical protein Pelo_887 [Pelomyxa schiedti]|nr:hypothetical protein Pelo_887 [Pelomyxa schiedti]